MSPGPPAPERGPHPGGRWRAWVALIWALVFAALYARSLIRERIPALAVWLPW